ncbi:MAG: MarR family transcriptional regulator [Proteobacteria bacterium]|nr:MarR family transcriptional regulator [Pseudomonadota bacterium]
MPAEDLNRTLGFLLHDASRLMRKRFDRRARTLGLTRAQWRVLSQLRRREGINQSALADILEIENITMGRHIDRLEDAGWVERRPDPEDRRAWRLYLAEKVQPILDEMRVLSDETREEALAGLSPDQRDILIDGLVTIKDNLLRQEAAESEDDDAATGTTG